MMKSEESWKKEFLCDVRGVSGQQRHESFGDTHSLIFDLYKHMIDPD